MKKAVLKFFVCVVAGALSAGNVYAAKKDKSFDVKVGNIVKAEVADKKIIITNGDGKKIDYRIKGICYAPDVNGQTYCENYEADIPLVKEAGANSIRTYRPLGCYEEGAAANQLDFTNSKRVLDACLKAGLTVTVGFSYEDMAEGGLMDSYLNEFSQHPAILIIALGNEYNYHYDEWFSKEEWMTRLKDAAVRAKKAAPGKLIATVHGEMPSEQEYNEYVNAGMELIMLNMYRGSNFGFTPQDWDKMSQTMPWVIGEFGRSSKDAQGNDTTNLQVSNLQSLIKCIEHGYLFSLVDDPGKGSGELSPAIGKEDSLGIYDKDRKPKKAVKAVKAEYDKINGAAYMK